MQSSPTEMSARSISTSELLSGSTPSVLGELLGLSIETQPTYTPVQR